MKNNKIMKNYENYKSFEILWKIIKNKNYKKIIIKIMKK